MDIERVCSYCKKPAIVRDVDPVAFRRWQSGELYVQTAFPQMSAGDREILLTGTHDECFHAMLPPEDDEEYGPNDHPDNKIPF